jgi:hypothetical protein
MAGDVGRYLSGLSGGSSKKKLALAALRRFFRVLVGRHIRLINPAAEAETVRYDSWVGPLPAHARGSPPVAPGAGPFTEKATRRVIAGSLPPGEPGPA